MWYDLLILGILLYGMLRGAARGLVWQLAWIAALVLCFLFAGTASVVLAPYIPVETPLNRWIAMFVLYIGFAFVSFGAARVLRGLIEQAKFVEFDRHLGGLLGLVKGGVFSLVLTFFVVTLSESLRETVTQSYSGYAACIIMEKLHPVMPEEWHKVVKPYIHRFDGAHQSEPGIANDSLPGHDPDPGAIRSSIFDDRSPDDENGSKRNPADETSLTKTGQPDSLQDLISALPAAISRELLDAAQERLRAAQPNQRESLIDRLRLASPDEWRGVLHGFGSQPNNDSQPHTDATSDPGIELRSLLQEIAAIYSDGPSAQQSFRDDILSKLNGVPDRVSLAALQDWYADLILLDPDPDTRTSLDTPLDERVLRQLKAAKIPLTRLSDALQDRLRNPTLR